MNPKKEKTFPEKIEQPFLYLTLGAVLPILFFLAGWWGSYWLTSESYIPYFMLTGLALGILLDLLTLKRLVAHAFQIPLLTMVTIYLFYSVGTFGFFMGVPLFNVFLGPLAGYYIGRRLRHTNPDLESAQRSIRLNSTFTALVMAVACTAALILAAGEATLSANINGMFVDLLGLKFAFDNQTILGLSVLAGMLLITAEYLLTAAVAKLVFSR
jgi:hypothetical protein